MPVFIQWFTYLNPLRYFLVIIRGIFLKGGSRYPLAARSKKRASHDRLLDERDCPSNTLRKWFAHREERWLEFKSRYFEELKDKKYLLTQLRDLGKGKKVTLLYAVRDERRNNAQAILEALETK